MPGTPTAPLPDNDDAGEGTCRLRSPDRTALWIRAGLRDLYGSEHLEVLYAAFRGFIHDRATSTIGRVRWDDATGAVQLLEPPHRTVTVTQWAGVADWAAFDAQADELLRAHRALAVAMEQLQRLGERPAVHRGEDAAPLLLLSPAALLRVLQPQIRQRLGTPAWGGLDVAAAMILTGVGEPGADGERDRAILAALERGDDPWLAGMRGNYLTELADTDPEPRRDVGHRQSPLPVAGLLLAALATSVVVTTPVGTQDPVSVDASAVSRAVAVAHASASPPTEDPAPGEGALRRGAEGAAVRELQRVLNAWYPRLTPLAEDGIYGPLTEERVRYLQRRADLVVDGVADARTLGVLHLAPPAIPEPSDPSTSHEEPTAADDIDDPADETVPAPPAPPPAPAPPEVVSPAVGVLTSGFGARWGGMHHGLDIANDVGTPIVAACDGTVIESGPASGFGLWVRLEHPDGTVSVYGHVHESLVTEGQQVGVGEQIATMGSRGRSTGPHLHFEIWLPGGEKIDPAGWLAEHGVEP